MHLALQGSGISLGSQGQSRCGGWSIRASQGPLVSSSHISQYFPTPAYRSEARLTHSLELRTAPDALTRHQATSLELWTNRELIFFELMHRFRPVRKL
jgi:hypothetical protein